MKVVAATALLCLGTNALQQHVVGRRAAVLAGTSAALTPLAAFAAADKQAALYQEEDRNAVGDAAVYKPFVKVNAKGASNSLLAVAAPSPGPRSVDDYVDCMWFMDAKTFKVVAAENYGPNGLIKDKSLQADSGTDPSFVTRVKSKTEVVPFLHAVKGGTWEGAPFVVN